MDLGLKLQPTRQGFFLREAAVREHLKPVTSLTSIKFEWVHVFKPVRLFNRLKGKGLNPIHIR